MADNELEISGKVGLPEWGGFAAHIEARFKTAWSSRGRELVEATSRIAGLPISDLEAHLTADERRLDVFGSVLRRATEVADPAYHDALARLLAAACDDAKVDVAAYVAGIVVRADPVELRCFIGMFDFTDGANKQKMIGNRVDGVPPDEAVDYWAESRVPDDVARHLSIDFGVTKAAFQSLTAVGLIEQRHQQERKVVRQDSYGADPPSKIVSAWEPSAIGLRLMGLLYPDAKPVRY